MVINFAQYIVEHANKTPNHLALVDTDNSEITYRDFCNYSQALASYLVTNNCTRVGILSDRCIAAYVGVVASAWVGIGYVAFSLKASIDRLFDQLGAASCDSIIIDGNGAHLLNEELLSLLPAKVIAADESAQKLLHEKGVASSTLASLEQQDFEPVALTGDEEAYIIFTSGSSGKPKGVVIPTSARNAFVETLRYRHPMYPTDRIAQPNDLAWDASVYNMALAFVHGASLFLMPMSAAIAPARFIRKKEITVWRSVATVGNVLAERGTLQPNVFPTLRWSSFVGAPLFGPVARAWMIAAPNSVLVNSYGPTEMAVECIDYTVPKENTLSAVPIGNPWPSVRAQIMHADGSPVADGEAGELWLSGPQQAKGYLNNPEQTEKAFVTIENNGGSTRWYKTGDLSVKDKAGLYWIKGRIDQQIKVLGYRTELGEIEAAIRAVTGKQSVAVSGYPFGQQAVEELVAFIPKSINEQDQFDNLRQDLAEKLPPYMIPSRFYLVESLPKNSNGKLDRSQLPKLVSKNAEI